MRPIMVFFAFFVEGLVHVKGLEKGYGQNQQKLLFLTRKKHVVTFAGLWGSWIQSQPALGEQLWLRR